MPGNGGGGLLVNDQFTRKPSGQGMANTDPLWHSVQVADWIAWQRRGKDLASGGNNDTPPLNITYSGLAPYLNIKRKQHATDAEAHTVAIKADEIFRCPADRYESHVLSVDATRGTYLYSYAMNRLYTMSVINTPGFPTGTRFGGMFNGKINTIKSPSEKVLIICQDENSLGDGAFSPDAVKFKAGEWCDLIADRHEARKKKSSSIKNPLLGNEDARGNVAFADGHCEVFSRRDSLRRKHSGSPNDDPPNL
jgi:prepilin-type processing-associated H-X9-DG protein